MSWRAVALPVAGMIVGLTLFGLANGNCAELGSLLGPEKETLLYDGDLQADSGGIRVDFWGSGRAKAIDSLHYEGPAVLRVASQGPSQGIVLRFRRSADLTQYRGDRNALVDLRVRPAAYVRAQGDRLTRRRRGRIRTTRGEIGFSAQSMRLVLFTDRGRAVASQVPLGRLGMDDEGWYRVSYPLAEFHGAARASRLRAVGLFTDQAETFYLGRIRLVLDRTPVRAEIVAAPTVMVTGHVIDFSIVFGGGYIDPVVSWDFNSRPGIVNEDAVGRKVKYMYKRPGDYLVRATVTDRVRGQTLLHRDIGIHVEAGAGPHLVASGTNAPAAHLEGFRASGDETITIQRGGSLNPNRKSGE